MADLRKIFSYIDANKNQFVNNLKEAVAIKSVSSDANLREEVRRMVEWTSDRLRKLGATVILEEQTGSDRSTGKPLPPILMAELGTDPKKHTLLIYGHLDVVAANKSDGWDTDPFVLTETGGHLYGRGTTDDKGPVLGWLHAIQAYQSTKNALPLNLKFCLEGMEENGSIGLSELLEKRKTTFLQNVDFVAISDSYWLGNKKPCLCYGLRGLCQFTIDVEAADRDLHSGAHGGSLFEAMRDLVSVFHSLTDDDSKIKIDGIMDDVLPVTEEEKTRYEQIDFDVEDYQESLGANQLTSDDKTKLLMSRWRFPSLSIHGIQGAFSDEGNKTIIPRKVIGKFSIRIVPDQKTDKVEQVVLRHLRQALNNIKSPNKFNVAMVDGPSKPWITDPSQPNFQAAAKAIKRVFNVEPDFIREGLSIPVALTLESVTGKSPLLLPMGAGDDGAHGQNEKIDVRNYIEGTKVFAAYFQEIAALPPPMGKTTTP